MPMRPPSVNPVVDRLAAYAWRILVIAGATVGVLWLVGKLWVVFLPLVIAVLLGRILSPAVSWLEVRRWRRGIAAMVVLVGFLAVLAGGFTLLGMAVGSEVEQIGSTLTEGVDDIENWLVNDAPFNISRGDINEVRSQAGDAVGRWFRSSSESLVAGAVVAIETVVSLFLGLIVTFFVLKDGRRFARWGRSFLPDHRHELADRIGERTWRTIGGYLKGAAMLGLLEGVVIGATMALVGADLAAAVGVFAFVMAFIPFAGAIVAGLLATLVTLATAGGGATLIVVVVMVVVQQLDSDLLAPLVYGKELDIHPVLVLLSIVGGGALFGFAGTVLAVPVTAVIVNALAEYRTGPPPEALEAGG